MWDCYVTWKLYYALSYTLLFFRFFRLKNIFFKICSELQSWSVLCFNVVKTLRFCCSLCKDDSDNFSSILKTGDSTTKGSLITWLTFQKIWSYHQKIIPKQCVHTSTFWRHSITQPTKYSHIPQTRQTWKYFTSHVLCTNHLKYWQWP